jgi:hypothetical protein
MNQLIIGVVIIMITIIIGVVITNKQVKLVEVEVEDVTFVENDQCIDHYDPIMPTEKISIKFAGNHINIKKHNNGEIYLGTCTMHYAKRIEILYRLLNQLIDLMNNAEWCLYYGSLVGLQTRGELLPWDPDIDIIINKDHISKLPAKFETDDYTFNIRTPGNDEDVIGRFIDKRTGIFIDITYYNVVGTSVLVKKMPTKADPNQYTTINYDKFYPITYSSFKNGIVVPIPKDANYCLEQRYGTLTDDYQLVNDKYLKIRKAR